MSKKEMNTVWPYVVSANNEVHTLNGTKFGRGSMVGGRDWRSFMDFMELELRF